jgi:hypothetical protein
MRDNLNQETGCFLILLLPLHLTVEELQQMIYVPSIDAVNILGKRYEQSKVTLRVIKGGEVVWDSGGMNPHIRNLGIRLR